MTAPLAVLLAAVAVVVVVAVVAAVVARRRFGTAVVRGGSMAPTFTDGERVLTSRAAAYAVGDVVVFRAPPPPGGGSVRGDPPYRIKRVAAVAGDPVPEWMPAAIGAVPDGCVVVSGDNARSQDSRQLGFVPLTRVSGRVIRRLR